jgi:ABC-type transport system involved in multi-copper enzyme maturation permease subunit
MTLTGSTAPALPAYSAPQRVTQTRVLRSEWTKLRSLPSTAWSLLSAGVLIVGFCVLYSMVRVTRPPRGPADIAGFDPTAISLAGVQLAQLAIAVLGVLLITGEYATGSARTSFAAVPRRLPVLWGKAMVFALTTLGLCVPAAFAAFVIGQTILSSEHLDTTLGHPGTARAILGSALYLTAVGLLGLGLGALLRNTAGAISAMFGVLFGLQIVVGFLPGTLSDQIYRYLPVPAGVAVTHARPDPASLRPWTGLAVFCLYTAVVLGLAAWRLRRRDA